MSFVLQAGSRPVHLRVVRPKRRVFAPMGSPRSDRRQQLRALCGEWVSPAEAIRMDRGASERLAWVTCDACARALVKAETTRAAKAA